VVFDPLARPLIKGGSLGHGFPDLIVFALAGFTRFFLFHSFFPFSADGEDRPPRESSTVWEIEAHMSEKSTRLRLRLRLGPWHGVRSTPTVVLHARVLQIEEEQGIGEFAAQEKQREKTTKNGQECPVCRDGIRKHGGIIWKVSVLQPWPGG